MTGKFHADQIRSIIAEIDSDLASACRVSFAKVAPVDKAFTELFNSWLSQGFHAGMQYMENHGQIRCNPALLLKDQPDLTNISGDAGNKPATMTATIMMFAFSYNHGYRHDGIASYALGNDYHDVLRQRVSTLIDKLKQCLKEQYGYDTENDKFRICIDSAPLHERYWAVKSGLGYPTRNGNITVPGMGSMVFLASVIMTLDVTSDTPLPQDKNPCEGCNACIKTCPSAALQDNGIVDSRRCLNYLTIEHRGEWDEESRHIIQQSSRPIFGCDACLRVCPLNKFPNKQVLPEFRPRPEILSLTTEQIQAMTQEEFSTIFKGSPIKRCKLYGLKRNLSSPLS